MFQAAHAMRQWRKSPVSTAVAVLSIALGIGANTLIFALTDEFLLRWLPVRNPHELVLFRAIHGIEGRMSRRGEGPGQIDPVTGRNSGTAFSLLAFDRFRAHRSALSDVFAYAPFSQVNVLIDGVPETTVAAQFVSGSYYTGLGVPAALGRPLSLEDDDAGAASAGYAPPQFEQLHARIQERLARLPGVTAATFSRVPLLSRTRQNMTFSVPGQPPPAGVSMNVLTNGVASNFFDAMELRLV